MSIEFEIYEPIVYKLSRLNWQELEAPNAVQAYGLLDEVLTKQTWVGIRIIPKGPETIRKSIFNLTDEQKKFLVTYLFVKAIDKYLAIKDCGHGFFYRLINVNSVRSTSIYSVGEMILRNDYAIVESGIHNFKQSLKKS